MLASEYDSRVFSFYVEEHALALNMVPRFWAYSELIMLIEDKVQLATRKHGPKARKASRVVAQHFVDLMIEQGGFTNVQNEFGGTMHQFQAEAYKTAVKKLQDNDPLIQACRDSGKEYWINILNQ